MDINFRARGISRVTYKLIQTPTLIIIKKDMQAKILMFNLSLFFCYMIYDG
jgi:hypothetical protein